MYDCGSAGKDWDKGFMGMFKIPWASAETALVNNGFPDKSFVVTQLNPNVSLYSWICNVNGKHFTPTFSLKPNLYRRRFLYRGQTEEY